MMNGQASGSYVLYTSWGMSLSTFLNMVKMENPGIKMSVLCRACGRRVRRDPALAFAHRRPAGVKGWLVHERCEDKLFKLLFG